MPYKKNDSKINRNGRPKGSANKKTGDLRQRITYLIEKNFEMIEEDFSKLDSEKRLIVLERYLKYCLPPLQSLLIQADIDIKTEQDEIAALFPFGKPGEWEITETGETPNNRKKIS